MLRKCKGILIGGAVLLCFVLGLIWAGSTYLFLNGRFYARESTQIVLSGEALPEVDTLRSLENLQLLDVRQIPVEPEAFEALAEGLPGCEILWKVPLSGGSWDNTEQEITVTTLDMEDLDKLAYFADLKTVDARGCTDYSVLLEMKARRPELAIMYTVCVEDQTLRENATHVTVGDRGASQLPELLPLLDKLESVDAGACTDYESLMAIQEARPELEVRYSVTIAGTDLPGDSTQITLENVDGGELIEMLGYLPKLTDVTLTGTLPDKEIIYTMMQARPEVTFHWDFQVLGVQTSSTATELILSNIPMESTEAVEEALKYFYALERVEMCECGIPSEEMDALGQRHPETRFVWSIHIGSGSVRTDAIAFIPFKVGYNIDRPCYDSQLRELKYCVDLICLDLGHMRMTDISFLHYMPKMKYLILADIVVKDFSVLAELKELVYLELFRSDFEDVSLLLGMTKLEDLNIGWTPLKNPELLKEMPWLKRIWITRVGMTEAQNRELKAALPNTVVHTTSAHPTEGGWRQAQNYYDMRDLLGMFYMK